MFDFQNNINRPSDVPPVSLSRWQTSLEIVDMSILLGFEEAQGEGEPDLIVELIDLYLAGIPQQLSVMRNSVLKADRISLKRVAHNLKGSSANLGVNAIAMLCEEIEQVDFNESFQELNILIDLLEQTFARVRPIFLAERQSRIQSENP